MLEESKVSKGSTEVEAEITTNSISKGGLVASGDQIPLKDALAAIRNTTQAAACIQVIFRSHFFGRKQQREDCHFVFKDEAATSSSKGKNLDF